MEHHDWEDNHVLQIHREPARAYFIPYAEQQGDRMVSLNGAWQFRWTKTPEERARDFYRTDFDASSWTTFPVPANWEQNTSGHTYGTPIYISAGYPFKIDPPYVTREPKKEWTTYVERNPTGQYRRTFSLPACWQEGVAVTQQQTKPLARPSCASRVSCLRSTSGSTVSELAIVRARWSLQSSILPATSRKVRTR